MLRFAHTSTLSPYNHQPYIYCTSFKSHGTDLAFRQMLQAAHVQLVFLILVTFRNIIANRSFVRNPNPPLVVTNTYINRFFIQVEMQHYINTLHMLQFSLHNPCSCTFRLCLALPKSFFPQLNSPHNQKSRQRYTHHWLIWNNVTSIPHHSTLSR